MPFNLSFAVPKYFLCPPEKLANLSTPHLDKSICFANLQSINDETFEQINWFY
jgi:hypothetical protein